MRKATSKAGEGFNGGGRINKTKCEIYSKPRYLVYQKHAEALG